MAIRGASIATLMPTLLAAVANLPRIGRERAPAPMVPAASGRPLPVGYRYTRHQGEQEKLRRMRQSARRVAKLKDEASILARQCVIDAVAMEPEPEYGALHLTHTALLAAEETGQSWAMSVAIMLTKFEENAEAAAAA